MTTASSRFTSLCLLLTATAALAQPGSFDTSFNAAATTGKIGLAVAVQPDGKVIAAGTFGLLRLLDDGSVDSTFSPPFPPGQTVVGIALQPDGRIIVRAAMTNAAGAQLPGLMRLHNNGALDSTFNLGPGLHPVGGAMAVQPDGKIIVGGDYLFPGSAEPQPGMFRVLANGALDTGFDARWLNSTDYLSALALSPEGVVYLTLTHYVGGIRSANSDGSVNEFFQPEFGYGPWGALAMQPDRRLMVGQGADGVGAPFTPLRRLLPNGEDDPTWLPTQMDGGDSEVRAILVQPDGRIVVGGNNFNLINGFFVPSVGRLHPDGEVDTSFDPAEGGEGSHRYSVEAMALAPDGKIVVAGFHVTVPDYTPRQSIWRLNNEIERGIEFAQALYTATEGDRAVEITLRRTADVSHRASVRYQMKSGTAVHGRDFTGSSGVVHFASGQTTASFTVRVKSDREPEGTESVLLTLSRPVGASLGAQQRATLAIVDR